MKRYNKEQAKLSAAVKFTDWIAGYGLQNALKIHAELGRMLRAEKKRRQDMNMIDL